MVYAHAARKTGAFLVLALVLSLAIVTIFTDTISAPTGRATGPGLETPTEPTFILPFVLGVLVGALMIGTYFYIVHLEAKK
jgi:hypothetical protein